MLDDEMRDVLKKVCGYQKADTASEEPELSPIRDCGNSEAAPFVGIDGSYSFFFSISGAWVGVVRVCALKYEMSSGGYRQSKQWIKEEPVIVSANPDIVKEQDEVMQSIAGISSGSSDRHVEIINRVRTRKEQELALEIAGECC